jgi:hypothetical protein
MVQNKSPIHLRPALLTKHSAEGLVAMPTNVVRPPFQRALRVECFKGFAVSVEG